MTKRPKKPERKLKGMPRAKKGDRFLVIKGSGKGCYHVIPLKKKKRTKRAKKKGRKKK